jgi:hypothetical protein
VIDVILIDLLGVVGVCSGIEFFVIIVVVDFSL